MNRKWFLLICALLLAALSMPALAAEGDVLLHCGENEDAISEYIATACAVGDTLYLAAYEDAFYAVAPGAEPEKYAFSGEYGELEYDENVSRYLLSDGERPVLLSILRRSDGSMEAGLFAISLSGGEARAEKIADVDAAALGDGNVRDAVSLEGCALIRYYVPMGDTALARLNLKDGSVESASFAEGEIYAFTAYTEGRALIETYNYDEPTAANFYAYDPADDSTEALGAVEIEEYNPYGALACDMESGEIYCVSGGEIFQLDLEAGQLGDAVASAPGGGSGASAWILPSGRFACVASDAVVVRDIRSGPAQLRRLAVCDLCYESAVERAYFDFQGEHGEANVVLAREAKANLIEQMMSRDASVDVYVIYCTTAEFEAVRDRGYMADLTQSPALAALAERMYPNFREDLSSNGALAALPVNALFWQPRINEAALEALGRTLEDVPSNWSDFLDFLIALQADFPQDGSLSLLGYYPADDARATLFSAIFEAYQQQLARDPDSVDAREMIEILTKLEQIDFSRLGHPVQMPEEDFYDYDSSRILLTLNTGSSLAGVDGAEGLPVAMSLTADAPAALTAECGVAFVNPYSETLDLAIAFMETLAENLPDDVLYMMCSDLNDPVPDPNYEESLAWAEEALAEAQKAYDEAEPADKQALETALRYAQREVERVRGARDWISQTEIDWMRRYGDALALQGANWLYSDDAGDAYEQVQQYLEGRIDASQLMKAVDGKLRMMILEGR